MLFHFLNCDAVVPFGKSVAPVPVLKRLPSVVIINVSANWKDCIDIFEVSLDCLLFFKVINIALILLVEQ